MMNDRFLSIVAFAAAMSAGATCYVSAANERQVFAEASLGAGTVRAWRTESSLGVTIDGAALASLPRVDTRIDLPVQAAPYRLIEIDFHPHGHEPKGIYDVPHFDAHFYVIDKQERDSIVFAPPGVVAKPEAAIVPPGYVSDGTVIPQMGMHFVSAGQPEFHGRPFMCSQIWGYNAGRLAFVEAMFSTRFTSSRSFFEEPLARPRRAYPGIAGTMTVSPNPAGGYDVVIAQ